MNPALRPQLGGRATREEEGEGIAGSARRGHFAPDMGVANGSGVAASRREFVRTLVYGGAVSMVMGPGANWRATAVASVQTQALAEFGVLRLRLADFPSLGGDFGSVRLGLVALSQTSPLRPLIVTQDGGQFFAVSSECTHAGCTIPAFAASKISTCPCHGSRYRPDGTVQRGPATFPLDSYFVELEGEGTLKIELPEIPAYQVTIRQVLNPAVARVSVEFPSLRNIEYEVWQRPDVGSVWQPTKFALTEAGAADQSVFKATGGTARVYVERAGDSGVLAVGMKPRTV